MPSTPIKISTKMTKLIIKFRINILNAILLSELMSLNSSEISTYRRMHFELKNVQNVLGILLKNILKNRNNRSCKNLYSINYRMLRSFNTLLDIFGGKINIVSTSKNI